MSLDLKLHFSFLSREVDPSRLNQPSLSQDIKDFFAEYLSEKVDLLTSIPSLSKYFAVSYIQVPQSNSIFQESFSNKWHQQLHSQLKACFVSDDDPRHPSNNTTKLETFLENYSRLRALDRHTNRNNPHSNNEVDDPQNNVRVYKSSENKKMADMLSRRESLSLSLNHRDLSEQHSSSLSEVVEVRRRMYRYKLMLQQKEHKMRVKDWENRETLEKAHKKWNFFVRCGSLGNASSCAKTSSTFPTTWST